MAVEAQPQRLPGRRQVDGRRNRHHRLHHGPGLAARLLRPAQQGIAAQRHPHGQHRAGVAQGQPAQHPVQLFVIAQ